MKTAKWRLVLIAAIALLLGSGLTTPHNQANASGPTKAASPSAPAVCGQINIVPSLNPSSTHNELLGVSALASNDVWAVGFYLDNRYLNQTLAEHWDGAAWAIVPSPNVGSKDNKLLGVSAVASNDVWAIGFYINSDDQYRTLMEHWDGAAWAVVPSPNPGDRDDHLYAVSAQASNDVWAVGFYDNSSTGYFETLVEHWNGTVWLVVPSPNFGSNDDNVLYGVSARASNDVWVDGYADNNSYTHRTLVEHWDGTVWSVVPSSNIGGSDNRLFGVSAVASNDVWAVGRYLNSSGNGHYQTLVEHWNGTAWSVVPSPNPGNGDNELMGVAALASNDIWVVGFYADSLLDYVPTLVEHWDGASWSVVPSPNFASSGDNNFLVGVSARANNDVWVVGNYSNSDFIIHTLVERHDGSCGSPTSTPPNTNTPTRTNTPGGPTNTPTPTATPQPTVCANPFVDVNTNIFFHAINILYCEGMVNGTDATHFSPAGTSTRAQFAKVVVLGFGFFLYTPGGGAQDFTDVPPTYFAYSYIETGFHAGILSGFDPASCTASGATPPCYLPNRPITRAQLTKLIVNAAQYAIYTPSSDPTFSDVGPSNIFFAYIETAYHAHAINGYPDGTFRPNNNIRRDEMAQIVFSSRLRCCFHKNKARANRPAP